MIVAEIGVNWNGLNQAKQMIARSKNAGADAVKFQMFSKNEVEHMPKLHNMILTYNDVKELSDYSEKHRIEFICTPMYPDAVDVLESIGVNKYKIRYKDRYNDELIDRVMQTGKDVYISCQLPYDRKNVKKVYCIPEYPPKINKINTTDMKLYDGYSNHYPSIIPPLYAIFSDLEYIEVHVKLNDNCIDHAVSLTFNQLKMLCSYKKNMELMSR